MEIKVYKTTGDLANFIEKYNIALSALERFVRFDEDNLGLLPETRIAQLLHNELDSDVYQPDYVIEDLMNSEEFEVAMEFKFLSETTINIEGLADKYKDLFETSPLTLKVNDDFIIGIGQYIKNEILDMAQPTKSSYKELSSKALELSQIIVSPNNKQKALEFFKLI